MTVVAAGAGFGKTTLLVQMVHQNRLAPVGIDRWLSCRSTDDTWSGWAASLAGALDVDPLDPLDPAHNADLLHDGFARLAPDHVCLVIDDVHVIAPGSPAAGLLSLLVECLPPNGHLVLAGRTRPPVALTRLAAHGEVHEIDERTMAFSAAELDQFADLRAVDPGIVAPSAGWPALAELCARAGQATASQFLWEEVLGQLTQQTVSTLAVVSALGAADDGLLERAAEGIAGLPRLHLADLDGVPLVETQGSFRHPHALWSEPLGGVLSDPVRDQVRRQGARELARRGLLPEAVRLALAAGADDDVLDILRAAGDPAGPPIPLDVLREWSAMVPPALDQRAAVLLVRGVAAKSEDDSPARALELLEQARTRFTDDQDVDGELAALVHILHLSLWLGDLELQSSTVQRVLALEARGSTAARPLASLARAYLFSFMGDGEAALLHLDAIEPGALNEAWMALADVVRATVAIARGDSEQALALVEAVDQRIGTEFARFSDQVRSLALWHSGAYDEFVDFSGDAIERSIRLGRSEHLRNTLAWFACGFAYLGDGPRTVELTDRLAAEPSPYRALDASTTLAWAARHVLEGDEDRATRLLSDDALGSPIGEDNNWTRRMHGLALSYVLVPTTRAAWDEAPLPVPARASLLAARALVARRAHGDLSLAVGQDWSAGSHILTHLPRPWAIELAVAAVAGGDEGAQRWIERLDSSGFSHLRLLRDHVDPQIAAEAKRLVGEIAAPPASVTMVRLLGGLALERDGEEVRSPDWKRARVRQLLVFLATHGESSRDAVISALWPTLAPEAALNNFRVTLSYLQRVLEPERRPHEASYLIRQAQGSMRLNTGAHLQVDADLFDAAVTEAGRAARSGDRRAELESCRRALELYRGDLVATAHADDPVGRRTLLRSQFLSVALRTGELVLAERDTDEPLVLANRVLELEPWSERAYRLLVSTHLARGERTAARAALDRCLAAVDDLDVHPEPETVRLDRLTRLVSASEDRRAPEVRSLGSSPIG